MTLRVCLYNLRCLGRQPLPDCSTCARCLSLLFFLLIFFLGTVGYAARYHFCNVTYSLFLGRVFNRGVLLYLEATVGGQSNLDRMQTSIINMAIH